ncbi:DNA cytosine methyltransferase [Bacillus sp. FSL K6-3431]|uniref:DNA cytosine methyltransferase n=1 Tax=Bacillus sp. FSL K6-3431 TaxID=2921500 RepID=UPI0030FC037D
MLAGSVNYFSFWYEGEEKDGFIRQLTPLECERLMGLPENWTGLGHKGEVISDYARYKALGNAIAVPCAEYIMAGIAEVL